MINTENYTPNTVISWTDQHLHANVSDDAQDRAWYEIKSVMRAIDRRASTSTIMWDKVFMKKIYPSVFND